MIKNRTAQLIYQTFYIALGLVGIVASLGIFDNVQTIRWDFYVHFTNISNFLCIGVMFAGLVQTAKKKEDSPVSAAPVLKFIGILGILLTFLVFNIMLAGAAGVGVYYYKVVLPKKKLEQADDLEDFEFEEYDEDDFDDEDLY